MEKRRHQPTDQLPDQPPRVDVFMSCFNEEAVLADSINSLEKINYPNYNIILIDDKSTDNTLNVMRELEKQYSNIQIIAQPVNRGKAMALNTALQSSTADYILCVDADTLFEPQALTHLVNTIIHQPKVAAVTGRPIVKNNQTLMGKLQYLEYIMNIDMIKRSQSFFLNHILTVSGVLTLFRRSALEEINGWSTEALTEDIDATWRLYDAGYDCVYQPQAICYIYVPESVKGFVKQRIRWGRGGVEVLRNHFRQLPNLSLGQRFLAVDMILSYIWVFLVSFDIIALFADFIILHNLRMRLDILFMYYFVTLIFYFGSHYMNYKDERMSYRHYWFYLPFYFYAYWLKDIIIVFVAFYHLFDTMKFAAWGASDRGAGR